jgi:hypothetical protein
MGTTMLRKLVLCGACALVSVTCADGGKNPVAPESRRAPTSSPSYTLLGADQQSTATVTLGAVDGAAVVHQAECGIPDERAGTGKGHFVVTPSGNFHVVCHAETLAGVEPPTRAEVTQLDECIIPTDGTPTLTGVISGRGHIVVTPSGQVHLVCHGKVEAGTPT